MVDIFSHKIIDLIPSRKVADVETWLGTFPNLALVSRDGAIIYKTAISNAHEQAIQISDRFHLIKNLTEYAQEAIKRMISPKIFLSESDNSLVEATTNSEYSKVFANRLLEARRLHTEGISKSEICRQLSMDIRTLKKYCSFTDEQVQKRLVNRHQEKSEASISIKEQLVHKVKELRLRGLPIKQISNQLNISSRSVHRYLSPTFSPIRAKRSDANKNDALPYTSEIERRVLQGQSGSAIFREIQNSGYIGAYSSVIRVVRLFKNQIEQYGVKDICIKRTDILKLLYIPMAANKNLTSNHLNLLFSHYPLCKKIIELVWQFKELFNKHQPELLDVWVQGVSRSPINQFNSFISSINRDYLAVTNAIIYDYNNGLAEGKVNKLKVAKRIMYGRNHFEALRNKLLWKEHN
ncbi:hypothetical protein AwErysi_09990 [Erysipelotrichaceae bacterium]|nr:hypothetical protein AwErysi_09990 [Erysipelotrichaceae bacterium]